MTADRADAQGSKASPPTVVSTYGRTPTNYRMVAPDNVSAAQTSLDVFGKPCLTVGGYGRPFISNPNLYDHVVVAINKCVKRIKFEVCYYGTRSCIDVELAGNQRKESILGMQPSNKDFTFEFREKL